MRSVTHLPILTNSAEKAWRACARLYRLQYVDLIRPLADGEALIFGTLIHAALEAWWKAAKAYPARPCPTCTGGDETGFTCQDCGNEGVAGPQEWLRDALAALAAEQDPFRRATAEALMMGYHHEHKHMTHEGHAIEVLEVEREFSGPLVNPDTGAESRSMQRGGKLDVLVKIAGRVWVVEHKSCSEDFGPGSDYRRRLRLDTQVSGYHVGARLLGHGDVAGVLYDVIGKPALRPKKATPVADRKYTKATAKEPSRLYSGQRETDETPDEFQDRILNSIAEGGNYARFEVVRLQHEEDAAARDTWQRAGEIKDAKRLGRFPRNPSSCGMYNRLCGFISVCEGTATVNDGTRFRKADTAHEELGTPAEHKQAA